MSMSEGMIQSLIELDKQGELPLENSIDAMTVRAARLINRTDLGCIQYGHSADCVLIDPDGQTHFDPTTWLSAGANSPLLGKTLPGRVLGTWIGGQHFPR
jgi:dihydroorotase